ncbi:MAG: hypothetical protein P8N20_05915 [Flavobacteriaceae bacterium]|nr:hypothetical protein [Flavobacteriaceae bacterium]
MEKTNIEKYLRDQVNASETAPKKHLWEKLSTQLEAEKKAHTTCLPSKRGGLSVVANYWKWAVAAAVVGLLFTPFVWDLSTENIDPVREMNSKNPVVVDLNHTERADQKGTPQKETLQKEVVEMGVDQSKPTQANFTTQGSNGRNRNETGLVTESSKGRSKNETGFVKAGLIDENSKALAQAQKKPTTFPDQAAAHDIKDSVALILDGVDLNLLASESDFEREIDALLDRATAEIYQNPQEAISLSKGLVGPDSLYRSIGNELLFEVEKDLNTTFRAKVIQELKQNVIKLSQAMVQTPNN